VAPVKGMTMSTLFPSSVGEFLSCLFHLISKELGEGGVFGNEIFCLCIPVSVFFSFFIAGVRWVLFFLHRLFLSYFLVLGVGLFFFACYGEQMESWSGPT
jgi:hypothetical protein